jgi:hypothetical protein
LVVHTEASVYRKYHERHTKCALIDIQVCPAYVLGMDKTVEKSSIRVPVKFTPTQSEQLDALVKDLNLNSRSAAIKHAVSEMAKARSLK